MCVGVYIFPSTIVQINKHASCLPQLELCRGPGVSVGHIWIRPSICLDLILFTFNKNMQPSSPPLLWLCLCELNHDIVQCFSNFSHVVKNAKISVYFFIMSILTTGSCRSEFSIFRVMFNHRICWRYALSEPLLVNLSQWSPKQFCSMLMTL